MYTRVEIDTSAGRQRLARIRGRFENVWIASELSIRELVREFLELQFETEGRYGQEPWAPLSRWTLAKKNGRGSILIDKGNMYRRLTTPGSRSIDMGVRGKTIRATIRDRIASIHQTGADYSNGRKLVARPLVPEDMPPAFIRDLRNIITGYVLELGVRRR